MAKELDYPLLDMVTSDEMHKELILLVLKRNKVRDPERFFKENSIESKVMFRNIKTSDGIQLTAAVVINKAEPKDEPTSVSGPGKPENG